MHSLVRILLGLFLVFVGESPAFTNADSAARPNILIVTADNHGYGDLQCFNPGSAIQTPNLDRLASEGVKLTDFYTPSSTCTVSRAVVTALDRAIGRVLDSLDELGLSDNTFVFFCSDNRAFMLSKRGLEVASNAPLRDGGVTCWEGGVRVAALARWPGRIKPGSFVCEPLWSPDHLVACARLAGADLAAERTIDGLDPLPVLTGIAKSPHRSLYFTYGQHAGLRMGDWKIIRTDPSEPWKLFNLAKDVGEVNDVADEQTGRLAERVEKFQHWDRTSRQQQAATARADTSGASGASTPSLPGCVGNPRHPSPR